MAGFISRIRQNRRGADRGAPDRADRGLTRGLAWTMDQSKAEWFAGRFPYRGPPFVASGWVFKRDVFAYFIGRQESEIVVSPNSIRDVAVTKLLPLPKRASRSCPLPGANVLQ